MSRLIKVLALLAALTATVVLATGCGSSKKSSSTSPTSTTATKTTPAGAVGGSTLEIKADPGGALRFNKSKLAVKAGVVTIKMNNPSSLEHGIALEGNGVDQTGPTIGKGGTTSVSAKLKPGTYTFYCPVDGHKDLGMKGTLTVK